MTFEAVASYSDVVINGSKSASLRSTPVQLKEGVHTFLALAKLHPDLHPAVLAAILARPACERRSLLEAARASAECKLVEAAPRASTESKLSDAGSPVEHAARENGKRCSAETLSSDTDEVWEDAVEDLNSSSKKQPHNVVDMATVVVGHGDSLPKDGLPKEGDLETLERDAAESQRAWQETRQLGAWTRYTDCRKKLAEMREKAKRARKDEEARTQQEEKWSQLQALRDVHERRLAELSRRRERLRLSRQYHEQTRLHHAQLAQSQLQEQLRELEERQQLRRLQHLQRVQQLVAELAVPDHGRDHKQPLRRSASVPSSASSPTCSLAGGAGQDDVFTHMWDDFSHWEKMVNDDKESADPAAQQPARPASSSSTASVAFGNPPDLIPVMPSEAAAVWRHKSAGGHLQGNPQPAGRRHSVAVDGFEERKKWFEEALLSWHAQDDEEDFGTSLYAGARTSGDGASPRLTVESGGGGRGSLQDVVTPAVSPWHHTAWSAWNGPATSTY